MEIQLSMDEHRPPAPTVKPPARAAGRETGAPRRPTKCSGPPFGPATPQEANWQGGKKPIGKETEHDARRTDSASEGGRQP